MKLFSLFKKVIQIFDSCIKFPKERIKKSVAIEMLKTDDQCIFPQDVGATYDTCRTRKR